MFDRAYLHPSIHLQSAQCRGRYSHLIRESDGALEGRIPPTMAWKCKPRSRSPAWILLWLIHAPAWILFDSIHALVWIFLLGFSFSWSILQSPLADQLTRVWWVNNVDAPNTTSQLMVGQKKQWWPTAEWPWPTIWSLRLVILSQRSICFWLLHRLMMSQPTRR